MGDAHHEDKPLGIKGLIGLGFDGYDGRTRISRGPNFVIYGGSRETHQKMQQTALKFNKLVDERGKSIEQINRRELQEIVEEVKDDIS